MSKKTSRLRLNMDFKCSVCKVHDDLIFRVGEHREYCHSKKDWNKFEICIDCYDFVKTAMKRIESE